MGKVLSRKIKGMNIWVKTSLVVAFTLLSSMFMYQGWFSPLFSHTATNQFYYFKLDTTAVSTGADGNTSTAVSTAGTGKYSLSKTAPTASTSYASNTAVGTSMTPVGTYYSPAYTVQQTLSNPRVRIAARDSATGTITWQAQVYDYSTSGSAGNGTLIWTSGTATTTTTTTTNTTLPFTSPANYNIAAGHAIKVVVTSSRASGAITQRLYFYSSASTNSYFEIDETPIGVNVTNGGSVPANAYVPAGSTGKAVDSFTMASPSGAMTVTGVTVTAGGTAVAATSVSGVKIYRKVGSTLNILEGSDVQLGSAATFSGTTAAVSGMSESVNATAKNYLVVYDISTTPTLISPNATLTGLVTNLTVTGAAMATNTNTSSATLTIVPTTTITNGSDALTASTVAATGPSAVAALVDAFGVKTSGVTDNINSISVSLTPPGISSSVSAVNIISGGTTYTASQQGTTDEWRANTVSPQLVANTTEKSLTVQILPKNTVTARVSVNGTVTAITHSAVNNPVVYSDSTSSTVYIDGEGPSNPVLSATQTVIDTPGFIDLSWTTATDPSGLAANAYKIVRGDVNSPAPDSCSAGTVVYNGPNTVKQDSGLSPGQSYSYRVCATDAVGNMNAGATASAVATLQTVCSLAPTITMVPDSQFVETGKAVTYKVVLINNDVGQCAPVNFAVSFDPASENTSAFVTPSVLSKDTTPVDMPYTLLLAPNGGSDFVNLTVTARATAKQGQVDMLVMDVSGVSSNSSRADSAPATKEVRTPINNYGPMLHSSLYLGTFRFGTWGENHTCRTCHSQTGANIKKMADMVGTPAGLRPVVFMVKSTSSQITSGVFGNDAKLEPVSANICEVCHHNTRYHQYSSATPEKTYRRFGHHNSSNCVNCHPHRLGFKLDTSKNTPACNDCHGNPPTDIASLTIPLTNALGPNPPANAGAHGAHNKLALTCVTCHSNANHDPKFNEGPDYKIGIGFTINGSNFPGFAGTVTGGAFTGNSNIPAYYSWATASGTTLQTAPNVNTCSVYCHGAWSGSGGSNMTPNWIGAEQVKCGTCHAATSAAPPRTGSHIKHAGISVVMPDTTTVLGLGMACDKCHGTYSNYSTSRAHVNGNVEWNLTRIGVSATYNSQLSGDTGAIAPSSSFGACGNLYCHSNVQGSNGVGVPTDYKSVTWGGKVGCGDCHVNMYNSPAATGGHLQHAQNDPSKPETNFDCRICHLNGGDVNPINHGNSKIDLVFNGVGANTTYNGNAITSKDPGAGYGSCSTSNCHGRRNITWGPATTIPLCDKCHGSATSTDGFYSTAGPGTTTDRTNPTYGAVIGTHAAHTRYSSSHRMTTSRGCDGCHQVPAAPYSAGHLDSALPAELNFATSQTYQNAGFSGYTSTPAYNYNSQKCSTVWCHGAGLKSNTGRGEYQNLVADSIAADPNYQQYIPVVPAWNVPLFDSNTSVVNGKLPNNCQKCHMSPPPAPTADYTHWQVAPGDCTTCHGGFKPDGSGFADPFLHINGKVEGGCNACHANPPIDLNGLVSKPAALKAMSSSSVGSHEAHVINKNIGKVCTTCHNGHSKAMPSDFLEFGFNAFGGKVTTGTMWAYSSMTNTNAVSTSAGTTVRNTSSHTDRNTCNVYCHGSYPDGTKIFNSGAATRPRWEITDGSQAACGSCHGTSNDASNPPNLGAHTKHVSTDFRGLTCDVCHGPIENNYHVNGAVEWRLKLSDPRIGSNATYNNLSTGSTGALAPSNGYGDCSNVYCHSNGQSGVAAKYHATNWSNKMDSMGCIWCHDGKQSGATATELSGKHDKHMNKTSNSALGSDGYNCVDCHAATVVNNTQISTQSNHANGFADYSGALAGHTYNAAGKTCSSVYCHSNGNRSALVYATVPAWDSPGALGCNGCHGTSNPDGMPDYSNGGEGSTTTNLHSVHATAVVPAICSDCHAATVDSAGAILTSTVKHADGTANVSFAAKVGGTASWTAASATCSNISCHSSLSNTSSWGQSVNCTMCHALGQLSGAHKFHIYTSASFAPTVYNNNTTNRTLAGRKDYNFGCANCHPLVNANHKNGVVMVNLSSTTLAGTSNLLRSLNGPGATYNRTTGTCDNIYCHSNGGRSGNQLGTTTYYTSPAWNSAFSGDKCAMCHGNSPNSGGKVGSPAHYNTSWLGFNNLSGGHAIGIHSSGVYAGLNGTTTYANGSLAAGSTTGSSHGNTGASTTISCNVCHSSVITTAANDHSTLCLNCHTTTGIKHNPSGDDMNLIANPALHVNGTTNVQFAMTGYKTKAQVQESQFALYTTSWSRPAGYKVSGGASYDLAKTDAVPAYNRGDGSCANVVCHNNVHKSAIKWGDVNGITNCASCHIPQ